ncbi:MAG: hypothetical protein R3190_04450 [Thermoanaerobaculia bacterium]|nr:hypothetical protein [Thermoanaerobaculia bacterium]
MRLCRSVLGLAWLLAPAAVVASDHLNLEAGLPIAVEDAYPVPRGGIEVLARTTWERSAAGRDELSLVPELDWGFAFGWEAALAVPWQLGGSEEGVDEVGVELLYNFNAESLRVPAFAVSFGGELPTSSERSSFVPEIGLIVTRTLGAAWHLDRLHLNLGYRHDGNVAAGGRADQLTAVVGYGRRLGPETLGLAALGWEQEEEHGADSFLFEVGVRHQATPRMVWSVGAGAGLNRESPDFRLTVAVQRAL